MIPARKTEYNRSAFRKDTRCLIYHISESLPS